MTHLKKQAESRSPEDTRRRKINLAESGIIFVLVLSTCVYLGIRFAHQPLDEQASAAASASGSAPVMAQGGADPAVVIVPPIAVEPQANAHRAGAQGSAPLNPGPHAVESQAAEPVRQPLAIGEALPEVPIYVTYTSAEKTYAEGRFTEAAEMFAAYCDKHPANTWGHYMRGLSLWKAGRFGQARHALETALRLQPDHLKSLINLARVELELAEYDAALAAIERALDVAPQNVEALRVLGRVYHQLERPDTAAAIYLQALRLKIDDAWALNNLGLIYIQQEAFDRALPVLARASELAPDEAVIRNNLGTALERTGHPSQAMAEYEHAMVLGSARGEENFARLDAVIMPADEPTADLSALAAAWSAPAISGEAVAVAIPIENPDHDQ